MRRWVKLWVAESLQGTIRFDFTPEERGVWYDLLLLTGQCRLDGVISPGSGQVYPHTWIAGTLNVPLELLERTLKKCEDTERIEENGTGIHILNWAKYQSEYDRQKPYRNAKKKPEGEGKYEDQKHGHMAARTAEDIKRIKSLREKKGPKEAFKEE